MADNIDNLNNINHNDINYINHNDIDYIDDIDDIDYNYENNNNNDDNNLNDDENSDIERAIQLSLNDVKEEFSRVHQMFDQYIVADDEVKNYMIEDLSEDELNQMFSMIQKHNDDKEQLERKMLIQLQDMEFNESLKRDMEKLINEQSNEESNEKNIKEVTENQQEKQEDINNSENLTPEQIRKKRLDFLLNKINL